MTKHDFATDAAWGGGAVVQAYGTKSNIDVLFLFCTFVLFLLVGLLPEVPLLSKPMSTTSGIKLYYLSLEILFSTLVLLSSIKRPQLHSIVQNRTLLLVVGWLVWIFIAAFLSAHPSAAFFRSVEIVVHVVFLYSLYQFLKRYDDASLLIRNFILVGFLFYSVFLIFGWMLFRPWESHGYRFIFVGFGHLRHFGYYALIVFMVSAGLLWRALNQRYKTLAVVYGFFAAAASTWLFMLGGRGPFFAIIVSGVAMAILCREYFTRKFVVSLSLAIAIGLLLSLFVSHDDFGPGRLISTITGSQTLDEYSSSRLSIWQDSFQLVANSPLFGIGPDGYLFELSHTYPTTAHPHGIFPQALLEWGVPGTVVFFLIIALSMRKTLKQLAEEPVQKLDVLGTYWAVLAVFAFSLIDGILYHIRPTFLFVVLIALLLAGIRFDYRPARGWLHYGLLLILSVSLFTTVTHGRALLAVISTRASAFSQNTIQALKAHPSVLTDARVVATLANMSRIWGDTADVEQQLSWYRWAERNSSRPWYFVYLHAELLFELGKNKEAIELLSVYRSKSPENFQDSYDCLQARYVRQLNPG